MLTTYIVNDISLPIDASTEEAFSVSRKRLATASLFASDAVFSVYRRSIDARRRDNIKFVYSIMARGSFPSVADDRLRREGIVRFNSTEPSFHSGDEPLTSNIVVIGAGPAGLFAALMLAENGYRPIVIERGGSVAERNTAVERFKRTRVLDTDTNIQFGAGGAGTFSDGKLVTRVNDPLSNFVIKKFVEFGAPKEIEYQARPHIGTDYLSIVVDNMIERIRTLGGEVRYHTVFLDFEEKGDRIVSIRTSVGTIDTSAVILATGHSARDTYVMLLRRGVDLIPKPFSVGMRIEHLREDIDSALHGSFAGHPLLGHAEYNLSYGTKTRGVYTFCMCPGGEVVPATSEELGVVVNGMSRHSRSGRNSNSAVCCSIFTSDYGNTPIGAIEFQRRIERQAFKAGGSDYSAPITTFGDFVDGKYTTDPSRIIPTYLDSMSVRVASPYSYLPSFICDRIKDGILHFDKRIPGFADRGAVLTGAETRTSAPLRIIRSNESYAALRYNNLYPSGEGAGYAGGITSAAIDGIKTAIAVISRFKS